jgi:hypothetical protein
MRPRAADDGALPAARRGRAGGRAGRRAAIALRGPKRPRSRGHVPLPPRAAASARRPPTPCPTPPLPLRPPPACADGFFSRTASGDRLGRCEPVKPGFVAAGARVDDASNAQRECLPNSAPDASRARCLCNPGMYQLLGGQTPRCVECLPNSYTDEPNVRVACKLCPLGKVANADRTACSEWRPLRQKAAGAKSSRGGGKMPSSVLRMESGAGGSRQVAAAAAPPPHARARARDRTAPPPAQSP